MTRAQVAAGGSAKDNLPPAPDGLMQRSGRPEPANLLEVIRGFTAADWRDAAWFVALIAPTIASAAALILLLEPARP